MSIKKLLQLSQKKKYQDIVNLYYNLTTEEKINNNARYALCEALFLLKNFEDAYLISKEILKEADTFKNISFLSGLIASELGKIDEAIFLLDRAININKNNINAYILLSRHLLKKKLFKQSITIIKIGLKNNPNNTLLYFELAKVFLDTGNYYPALKTFLYIKELDSKYPLINMYIGVAYNFMNEIEKALEFTLADYKENKLHPEVNFNLGNIYLISGDFDKAVDCFSISKDNDNLKAESYRQLCTLSKSLKDPDTFESEIESVYAISKETNNEKNVMLLGYGMSNLYEKKGKYKKAYECFTLSNQIRNKTVQFNSKGFEDQINCLIDLFSKEFFSEIKKINEPSKLIFICGLPRSGTTLTEQIISSHSKVFAGGELEVIQNNFKKLFPDVFDKNKISIYKDKLKFNYLNIKNNILNDYSNFENLKHVFNTSNFCLTDKLPFNYLFIGFIKLCFPDAKIIHCTRNPRDNCLSILKNFFPGEKINFSYSEKDLYNYYVNYKKLMDHWNLIFKNDIYSLSYEVLVNDSKNEILKLLNYCNLEFEDNCLKYYENKNKIKTISAVQARQPIYKDSENLSKKYENFFSKDFLRIPDKIESI